MGTYLHLSLRGLFALFFFFVLSLLFTNYTHAQSDCDTVGSHWAIPVFVYDDEGRKWGSDEEACSPLLEVSVGLGRTVEVSPNYVKDIRWNCETDDDDDREIEGAFIIRTYKQCHHLAGLVDMSVTLHPPLGAVGASLPHPFMSHVYAAAGGYECTNWEVRGTDGGYGLGAPNPVLFSGPGCRATFPYPPDEYEWQVIMFMQPATSEPTPTPTLACPASFNAVCNGDGTATLSWSSVAEAVHYNVRANAQPYADWPTGPGDWAVRGPGLSTTQTVLPNTMYAWSVEPLRTTTEPVDFNNACPAVPSEFICNVVPPSCGDGNPDPGEQCDDGNTDPEDTHVAVNGDSDGSCVIDKDWADPRALACRNNTCGDGYFRPVAEQCDDGDNDDGDGCSSTCTIEAATWCGDGTRQDNGQPPPNNGANDAGTGGPANDGHEDCDNASDACYMGFGVNPVASAFPCMTSFCGDGIWQPLNGMGEAEQCDSGTDNVDGNVCNSDCTTNTSFTNLCPL